MPTLASNRCRWLAAAVCAAAMALSAVAGAQAPSGRPGGRGGSDGAAGGQRPDSMRMGPAADAPLNPGALVQRQLDRLEDDLKLTAAQAPAWGAYADNVQRLADLVERTRFEARTASAATGAAPEKLEWITAGMQGRLALMQTITEQGRTFYATLTPEQKKLADTRLWLPVLLLATGLAPAVPADGAAPGGQGRNP